MGSRKDCLKRSLGITEYPWSSDDELEPASAVEDVDHRRPSEPRSSMLDAPGSIDVPPEQPSQQQPSHQQLPNHQQQPGHLQESTHQQPQHNQQFHHQPHQQPQQPHMQPHLRSSRRNLARLDRDMFFSVFPRRVLPSHGSRSRSSEFPVSYVSRVNHVPAPELRERVSERPHTADIQRILAFKQLTRNFSSLRQCAQFAGVIPVTRVNPGVIVPSESNSGIRSNRLVPEMIRRRFIRATPLDQFRPRHGGTHHDESVLLPMYPGEEEALGRRHGPAPPSAGRDAAERPRPPPHQAEPEHELNNNLIASPPPDADADAGLLDEATAEQEISLDNELETLANNNSGAGVALEEEIVAMDMDVTGDVVADGAGAAGPDGAAPGADLLYGGFPSLDPNVPSTSDGITEPDGPPPASAALGIRRNRRDSEDNGDMDTICTVKEFNQNLLRLLECPVCLDWMEPPMSQCRRGHLVCGRCRARLASCPVCRTTFSSVRNRAMEGVSEMLRYPCRHGCGREVRLRRRAPHEASCVARKYQCPAPLCADSPPLPRAQLAQHFQSRHLTMMKIGRRHKFSVKVNTVQHDNWLIQALEEYFHLRIDVDIRTWGVVLYVSYIGPKCDAKNYTYEVTVDGQHNQRKLVYARTTHSDLESSSVNVSRQDCFHLTLDQAINFIRFKNRHSEADKFLDFNVEISKVEQTVRDDSES